MGAPSLQHGDSHRKAELQREGGCWGWGSLHSQAISQAKTLVSVFSCTVFAFVCSVLLHVLCCIPHTRLLEMFFQTLNIKDG